MKGAYTFVRFFWIGILIHNSSCFELNIGKTVSYSSGSTQVTVEKKSESQNLYTHKLQKPLQLKEIWNGDKKIYLDPLLVKDQLLLSASVIWSFKIPSVIQLNLEKSSVLLVNEQDSTLDVQAIFSEKLVTNLSPRTHSTTEVTVDVDLSKFEDYDNNNCKVYVTDLEFSEDRFKRYTLRNYNLESTKLGKILYKDTELKTKTENDSQATTESNLVIPYKDNIYSILVYAYNNFPLLLEVLYTFNRRQFYGYTAEKKWHHVLFPAFHDPSFSDFLYNKLNYYACKNGFKYTIDIDQKTASSDHSYKINNYCIGSEGVETVVNNLKLAFYIDEKSKEPKHRCFEHTPSDDNKFFTDHLMVGTSLLKLANTPNIIKCSRVYYRSNSKPHLIVLVDNSDVLHYYINRNEVWNEHKKETKVQFNERFNDSIRAALENVAPTVQVDKGSIVVLTDRKTPYNKAEITKLSIDSLPSSGLFDNVINVTENTQDKGSCIAGSGYKVYMHDLSSAASIFSHSSGSNIQFLFYVSNTKIGLYESTKINDGPLSLAYDKQNDLYVYFYREYPKALAVCYNGKLYRPYNSEEYTKKWVHVKQVNDCCCKSGSNQRNKALSDALFNVMELFNLVNPYEQTRDKTEYNNSSLFFEYTHRRPNSQQAHNIQVCKKSDCGKILKLTYGTEYSKCPLDKALVYFNRYYTNEKPLIISLHFGNSGETRYYEPSVIHDSSDADSSKPLVELNKYTNHSDFVKALLEKNDTLFTTVTYQIDKKDNSYNDKRVNVADGTSTVKNFSDNKFAKYVHSPTSGNTDKKCFILNKSNILKTWNTKNETYEPLDNIQNVVCKDVTVYFSTGLDIPLLVSLSKKDGSFDYYYIVKEGALTFWNQLDVSNYQKLLSETITTDVKIHEQLTESDCDKLLKLLKKIEASILNAVIVLLSERKTYDKTALEPGLRRSYYIPRNIKELSESQPDSITVEPQDYPNLKSQNFECFIHKIIPKGPFKTDLRIMVPSYDEYHNIKLIKPEPKVDYRSKIIFDLDQRGHRINYDAEKYYVNVQKKEFTNPPYIRYAHTCVSCGKLSEGEFTIKFDNIRVNFSNDIPETEQKRFDVYFHKETYKFSMVVFHQPGGHKPRYFGYSDFIEYHKKNSVVKMSSLPEFKLKYDDTITPDFRNALELEFPKMKGTNYLNTEILLYEKAQTDLYVYFQSTFLSPLMFCYDNKAYIPRSVDTYKWEWVRINAIKGCKFEGENELPILNTIAYVYMYLGSQDKTIVRDKWDYNANDDAIKTLPDNLSILTITNAKISISTIHNDKIKNPNRIQKLEIDFYYFNSYSTYVQYSGDLTNNLTITAKSNYGIDIIKFYKIVILTLPEGSYVHRIEYIRDTPTDEVTIHLHTNTLFVYSYVRKYDDWYKPFHFIGITRIKPFNHSNEVDKYFEKIRALNRKNFFITRIFKLT